MPVLFAPKRPDGNWSFMDTTTNHITLPPQILPFASTHIILPPHILQKAAMFDAIKRRGVGIDK